MLEANALFNVMRSWCRRAVVLLFFFSFFSYLITRRAELCGDAGSVLVSMPFRSWAFVAGLVRNVERWAFSVISAGFWLWTWLGF